MPDTNNRTHQATLGCGTLILIALIVMLFSNPGMDSLKREINELRSEIRDLKKTIETQMGQKAKIN